MKKSKQLTQLAQSKELERHKQNLLSWNPEVYRKIKV